MVVTVPFFGVAELGVRFRVALAIVLSLMILPIVNADLSSIQTASDVGSRILGEVAIGIVFGLMVMGFLYAAEMAGKMIASLCGTHFSDVVDTATQTSSPPLTRLFQMVAMLIFFSIGGHSRVVQGVLDSFQDSPPGQDHLSMNLLDLATHMISQSFELAVRIGAPTILALLVMMLLIAFATRANPAFGSIQQTMNINVIAALVMMFFSSAAIVWFADAYLDTTMEYMRAQLNQSAKLVASQSN